MLGRRIAARQPPSTCLPELWRALLDEWCNIPQYQSDNLILSMHRSSSKIAKLFLQGILNEFTRTGSEETTLNKVSTHVVTVCKFEGLKPPSASEISSVCAKLAASHVILSDNFQNGIHMKLRLGVDPDDVNYALTGKGLSR
ncbi:origin recognition complex subunit 1 [Trichonephila clavipes]|nr:origin recognition complex subunit 1 [Trichonephila clavipes]